VPWTREAGDMGGKQVDWDRRLIEGIYQRGYCCSCRACYRRTGNDDSSRTRYCRGNLAVPYSMINFPASQPSSIKSSAGVEPLAPERLQTCKYNTYDLYYAIFRNLIYTRRDLTYLKAPFLLSIPKQNASKGTADTSPDGKTPT